MNQNRELIREQLIASDPIFRKMVEDHQDLDSQADTLSSSHYLTVNEQQQLRKIKRKKLLIRDKMERRLQQMSSEDCV